MINQYRNIVIALPIGNLNRPNDEGYANCGHIWDLLKMAGFKMIGYEPNKEGRDSNGNKHQRIYAKGMEDQIEFICSEPRGLPAELIRKADMAIIGRDTMQEAFSVEWQNQEWKNQRRRTGKSREQLWEEYLRNNILANFERKNPDSNLNGIVFYDALDLGVGSAKIRWGLKRNEAPDEDTIKKAEKVGIEVYNEREIPRSIITPYPRMVYGEVCKILDENRIILVNDDLKRLGLSAPKDAWTIYGRSKKLEREIEAGEAIIAECVVTGDSFRRYNILPFGKPLCESTAHLYTRKEYDPARRSPEKEIQIDLGLFDEVVRRFESAKEEYLAKYPDPAKSQGSAK